MNKLQKRIFEIDYKYKHNHIGSALTSLPIIEGIYNNFNFDNDVFILSKGHASVALYAVLEKYGFKPDISKLHPDIDIKNGISITSGSLGHGLPIGIGMALAKKLKNEPGIIYVLLGDGECMEGTFWESLILRKQLNLDNISIWIDYNGMGALKETSEIVMDSIHMLNESISIIKSKKKYPHVYELTKKDMEKVK